MHKYSVLLLYPDYLAAVFGRETHYAWVSARSRQKAVETAQAVAANNAQHPDAAKDFHPLIILPGHIRRVYA